MLPSSVADDLVSGLAAPADFTRGLDGVTVLFCKIDRFHAIVEGLQPDALVQAPDRFRSPLLNSMRATE